MTYAAKNDKINRYKKNYLRRRTEMSENNTQTPAQEKPAAARKISLK